MFGPHPTNFSPKQALTRKRTPATRKRTPRENGHAKTATRKRPRENGHAKTYPTRKRPRENVPHAKTATRKRPRENGHAKTATRKQSPYYAGRVFDNLPNDWFNLSMTYHGNSTICTKYDELHEHRSGEITQIEKDEFWNEQKIKALVGQKSKFALQIVSKCGASSARDILTAQLGQLIPVNVFGACSGNECDEQCYGQQMKSHFFYLAFENSVCPEYVTEKFWNALRALTVPVVLHRTVLRGVGVPDDAYIAADDFCSVQQLAQYLLALRRDTDKYIQ
ncbi:hypothetical protein niasHS_007989 [Heterodera schachtii]|uniref:Fucosyltransferase n=1 Tax=Heterodera schachtii TaxID=97005 RepID=A0ABD2JQ76_HETSC